MDKCIDWESECKRLTDELNKEKADHLNDIERLKHENESLTEFINEYSSENAILNAQMDVVRLIFGD